VKRYILVFITLVILQGSAMAADRRSFEEKKSLLEQTFDILSKPAEEVIGSVSDLGKIVVSADKIPESSFMSASSISVINRNDIISRQKLFVKDLVTEYASVSMTESGSFGGPAFIRMRGANPNQTLLLLDKMKIYDPASPDGAFNFSNLSFDNAEQIEITRGPQGALYGSSAIGGVISIESRKPQKPFLEAGIEAGSFRTLDEYVNFGGYEKGLHYSFAYSQMNARGISNADSVTIPGVHEVDPYLRKSFAGKLDYEIANDLTVGATMRNIYARSRYDDSDPITYALRDNDQLIGKSNFFLYTLYVEHKPIEAYDYSVRYSYMHSLRRDYDYPAGLSDWYSGKLSELEFQNNFRVLDIDIFTIGYDYTQEISDSYYFDFANGESNQPKVFARDSAIYMQNKVCFKDIAGATQSIRVDNHSQFGVHSTYKFDGFYLLPTGTRVRGIYSTSFKAPSLYQLYAPANAAWWFLGGNSGLNPEEAKSYEIGIDQYLFKKVLKMSATYFQIRFSNLIKYYTDPTTFQSTYQNVSKAKSEGMEYGAEINLFNDMLVVKGSMSTIATKDYSTDREIQKVPQNQFNIDVKLRPISRLMLGANINHTGTYFDVGTDKIKQYTIVDLTADYALNDNFSIYGRMENLFNKHYQQVRGYGQTGLGAYGGVKAKF